MFLKSEILYTGLIINMRQFIDEEQVWIIDKEQIWIIYEGHV